jgi:hypothetical protein
MVTLKVRGYVRQYQGCSSGVVLGHGCGILNRLGQEVGESMGVLDRLERGLDCLWKVPRSWYSNYIGRFGRWCGQHGKELGYRLVGNRSI